MPTSRFIPVLLRSVLVCGLVLTLSGAVGCGVNRKQAGSRAERWSRELSRRGVDPSSIPNPLADTPEMIATSREVTGRGEPREKLRRLQRFLFDNSEFAFSYESRKTLTAAEAFEARSGNCVSFTNLFIAMGRAAGVAVRAAMARVPIEADRAGNLILINNHVVAVSTHGTKTEVYDFDRRRERRITSVRPIADFRMTAIFANNLGAQALLAGDVTAAADYLETAVKLDPEFALAYGNLGVVRRQLGDEPGALYAYGRALELEPRSPTILTNLAALYQSQGRQDEARAAMEAARLRDATPYMLISRANLALAEGRIPHALRLYRRAARVDRRLADPWLGVARAELARGHRDLARQALGRALRIDPDHAGAQELNGELAD